jgi:hypothetical protein
MSVTPVTPEEVGNFVNIVSDSVGADRRTPSAVAGRFIEEAVELCLAAGLRPEEVMVHVMDSIHNQCVKLSKKDDFPDVVYPSRVLPAAFESIEELQGEIADCSLVLKDLAFISGIDIPSVERAKWDVFVKRTFSVSPYGTLYAIKTQD